jgi:hypothetical protein
MHWNKWKLTLNKINLNQLTLLINTLIYSNRIQCRTTSIDFEITTYWNFWCWHNVNIFSIKMQFLVVIPTISYFHSIWFCKRFNLCSKVLFTFSHFGCGESWWNIQFWNTPIWLNNFIAFFRTFKRKEINVKQSALVIPTKMIA